MTKARRRHTHGREHRGTREAEGGPGRHEQQWCHSTPEWRQCAEAPLTVTNKGPDTTTYMFVTLGGLKRLRVPDAVPAPEATTRPNCAGKQAP
ncbi:hypothetical protein OIE61_43400 [Streptomyces sp. NBC_01762]|uniref:hypothetical protein n=1 Tax=Streptomyces sp. NBC_01762 TaxID=2975933 RepID=UPI002DD79DBB|nr:hypothetical protein [Streptomyces sp. NBC_01762]WSC42712.1 hypothetical protein OIE61_01080 [Streptomyces sp. NBC_01762]WSC50143.1 hypothetical protein OIE61_43400 [Streptomyces sp. NBC_01762]